MAAVNPGASSSAERTWRRAESGTQMALVVFGILVVGAPLAFGAVDRLTQVIALALFAGGLAARPAAVAPLGRWGNRLAIVMLCVLVGKEFLPASWFGVTEWRRVLVGEHGLALPWTHHPEPSRALDALCAGGMAALWFLWVRTLAADRETRARLAWLLLISAATVAAVSFATRGIDPKAIYGWRYTPGWTGFGPFPNRNHTACFLGMGLVLGCGCIAHSGGGKNRTGVAAALVLAGVTLVALLATQSRGGLLAAVAGVGCFLAMVVWKVRTKRAVALTIAGLLLGATLVLLAGAQVFGRFQSQDGGAVVDLQRLGIWKDALAMWRDAPLFGHGVGSFAQIFGIYQTVPLENSKVLHPESSWLQWLTELGGVVVALGAFGLVRFGWRHLRDTFTRRRSFFLRAGAFSAVLVLLLHGAIDVPAHRWGTLGFGLAALAIACPLRFEGRMPVASRRAALVPLALALFWALPFVADFPAWSPLTLQRLLARVQTEGGVPLATMERELRSFPLSVDLHQEVGLRKLQMRESPPRNAQQSTGWQQMLEPSRNDKELHADWQRHFAIASALLPGAWTVPATQARAVDRLGPQLAVGYWQEAVERAQLHRDEVFRKGVLETSRDPVARVAWDRYVASRPELLLPYAQLLPEPDAPAFYTLWWKARALTATLEPAEIDIFHSNVHRWGTLAQFDEWMAHHATWRARDFRQWAAILQRLGEERRAFELLAEFIPEPEFPKTLPSVPREQLEMRWRVTPFQNPVNAQHLALLRMREGAQAESDEIILKVAATESAVAWFRQKAAYIRARRGEYGEGVHLLLRTK